MCLLVRLSYTVLRYVTIFTDSAARSIAAARHGRSLVRSCPRDGSKIEQLRLFSGFWAPKRRVISPGASATGHQRHHASFHSQPRISLSALLTPVTHPGMCHGNAGQAHSVKRNARVPHTAVAQTEHTALPTQGLRLHTRRLCPHPLSHPPSKDGRIQFSGRILSACTQLMSVAPSSLR